RERVDALLPRVDAAVWVVDPEKYNDDVMHSAYLRRVAPGLRRQLVAMNRSDLLAPQDADRIADDIRAQLGRDGLTGIDVVTTRAREGGAGITALRRWLEEGVQAKRVIASRLAGEARAAVRGLAADAGVTDGTAAALIEPARTARAVEAVARGVLALVDIAALERQAVAATRLAARPRGAGPMGHLTSALYRLTGRARASADPAGYLRRWQLRGSLAPAVEPLRELIASMIPGVPAPLRGALATLSTPAAVEQRLSKVVDGVLAAEAAEFRVPTSALWTLIGAGQYAVTATILFCALWLASLFVIHDAPVGSIDVPYLGAVPTPVALLAGALLVGYLLALTLRWHAGWLGRRWARRIGARITREIRERVADSMLLPVEQLDASRARLAATVRAAEDCTGE
ncbi:MAG TPA: hypothetical protein VFV20_01520, partial [Candidatus Limnocylindria bacterium]|nr:hypothetical protein [Candidatus Limnocylindria bacterium]